MTKRAAASASLLLVATLALSGCLGPSEYCQSAETHETTLRDFGGTRTNEAFTRYAEVADELAGVAPEGDAAKWSTIADATAAVVTAQEALVPQLRLEDMADSTKVNGLSTKQMKAVNATYTAFNDTQKDRQTLVRVLADECDLDLRQPAKDAE